MNAARLRQAVTGWIYPPVCTNCEDPISAAQQIAIPFLCGDCAATLEPIGDDYCRICGQKYETAGTPIQRCSNCGDRELGIDFAVSAYRGSGIGRKTMHQFKYEKQRHLSRLMGLLISEVWRDERLHIESWNVVPVPLHPKRMRNRGFNQSREIASELARRAPDGISLTLRPVLKRVRHTLRQAQLDRRERLRNLSDAFRASGRIPKNQQPANWLIVDDVITTGTTVSECAAALRKAFPVKNVAAVSVLRG
jgi:ComF family protein